MSTEKLTGRSRLRLTVTADGSQVLVLQIEVGAHNNPITHWRDARVEDLSQTKTTPNLKVAS